MGKLIIAFLIPLMAIAQRPAYFGVVNQDKPVADTILPPPPPSGTTTLTLLAMKASPVAEGAGSVAKGVLNATTKRLGRVISTSPLKGTPTLVGTFNGVQLWEGTFSGLWQMGNILIVPRISGFVDGGTGTHNDRMYLYGDNVTYLGMLGPKDNIVFRSTKIVIGCPEGQQTLQRCDGFKENIVFNIKSYLSNPPIGTATTSSYGRNNIATYASNTSFFANISTSYGGDQNFDIGGHQNTAAGFPAHKYALDKVTVQHTIMGNGYGTGGLYGQNGGLNDSDGVQGDIDNTKNLWINISHRTPNVRQVLNYVAGSRQHKWNNYTYNQYGTRHDRVEGTGRIWTVNNIIKPGANSEVFALNRLHKWGPTTSTQVGNIFASGNLYDGQIGYSTNNQNQWSIFQTSSGYVAGDPVAAVNFTSFNDVPKNNYYLIDTQGVGGFDMVRDEVTDFVGSRWATDANGNRVSDLDVLQQRFINDAKNGTNTSWNVGIDQDSSANEFIPTLSPAGLYADTNNNLIADTFEAQHGLVADPFAVKTAWDFTATGDYMVTNTAGYPNVLMYAWWVNNYFEQLIDRGNVATDTSYTVN